MEDYILIVVAMKAAVDKNTAPNPSFDVLLDNLIAAMEREIEKANRGFGQLSKISVSFLISLSIAAIKLMMTDDLKFLRKLAEIRILFFVVKGFAQIHPKVLQCYTTSVLFRSIVLFAPWRCYTQVFGQ